METKVIIRDTDADIVIAVRRYMEATDAEAFAEKVTDIENGVQAEVVYE